MEPNQDSIDAMYAKMEDNGWNTAKPLKWGFFFFSKDEGNLKGIYAELMDHSYNVESVHQNEDGDYVLQVSKVEILPSDKLFRRCHAFNELAEAYDSLYDGWDVGEVT
jgi:hypothetical protein